MNGAEGPQAAGNGASNLHITRAMSADLLHTNVPAPETVDGPDDGAQVRPPKASERAAALGWLERGLRPGRPGRLAAEVPTLLDPGASPFHQIAWVDGAPAAHAVGRPITLCARGRVLEAGMIGLVYTDPAHRRRGLATRCVEACVRDLARAGAAVAVLWSDRHAFYERMGFHAAGHEAMLRIPTSMLPTVALRPPASVTTGPPRLEEWDALEPLIHAHPGFALREPGALRRLAAAPDCRVCVARDANGPVAYAALGRGDDFPGVVHEWAGDPGGVVACLEALGAGADEIALLCGPEAPEPAPSLRRAGARHFEGVLGLVRLLDPAALLAAAHPESGLQAGGPPEAPWIRRGNDRVSLGPAEFVRTVLGPGLSQQGRRSLPDEWAARLGALTAPPFFLWGFDSI